MSKILNDSELQEIRELSVYTHGEEWAFVTDLEGYVPALLDHIDALAASLDAEAAAHSVTRAALVASPEWELVPIADAGYQRRCPICKRYDHLGHADDCLRRVALEQAP